MAIETVCTPAIPGGVTAVTVVEFTTFTDVAATPPTLTADVPERFEPKIAMVVPPATGPEFGVTVDIVGAGTTYVNAFERLAVPPGVINDRGLAPTDPAGVTAVTVVGDKIVTDVAAAPPTVTEVVPMRFVPPRVIVVPPVVGPELGVTDEMVGAGAKYVKPLGRLAVPPEVVTETIFGPTLPGGVTAINVSALTTATAVAAAPPIVTEVVPIRFVPEMVMLIPPVVGPDAGATEVTVGAGR